MQRTLSKLLSYFTVTLTYLFLYAPIIVLVTYSFNSKGFPSKWEQFTLKWYYELFHSEDLWQSFFISLLVASVATSLSLLMGICLVFYHSIGGRIGKGLPLFYANLIFPETVVGISLMSYFLILRIPLGIQTLIVSHTILGIGFVIPVVYMRYKQIDKRIIEASMILGATRAQTFFRITLPLIRPTLIAGGLMIFILSFDDFALSYFCAGTHIQTLSLHLLSMIRIGIQPTMNALSTILLILTSCLVIIFFSPRVRSRIF